MTIKHFLPLGLSARICSEGCFFFFLVYRHQPSCSKALLYLADKFCPQMAAHCLLVFVSLKFLSNKVNKLPFVFQGAFFGQSILEPAFYTFWYKSRSPNSTVGKGGGRIDGSGLGEVSQCCLVRFLEQEYI